MECEPFTLYGSRVDTLGGGNGTISSIVQEVALRYFGSRFLKGLLHYCRLNASSIYQHIVL